MNHGVFSENIAQRMAVGAGFSFVCLSASKSLEFNYIHQGINLIIRPDPYLRMNRSHGFTLMIVINFY